MSSRSLSTYTPEAHRQNAASASSPRPVATGSSTWWAASSGTSTSRFLSHWCGRSARSQAQARPPRSGGRYPATVATLAARLALPSALALRLTGGLGLAALDRLLPALLRTVAALLSLLPLGALLGLRIGFPCEGLDARLEIAQTVAHVARVGELARQRVRAALATPGGLSGQRGDAVEDARGLALLPANRITALGGLVSGAEGT